MGRKKGFGKCVVCGEWIDSTLLLKIDGRNYCSACGKDLKAKREKEIKINTELNDFLYELCGRDKDLMPFLGSQVKRLQDNYEWRADSILYTLKYVFCENENPPAFNPDYGIQGLVIRNYSKAKKYYTKVFELKKRPEEEIMEILQMPPKEITIKRSEIQKKDKQFLEKRKDLIYGPELDMDDIIDDTEFYEEGEIN